VNKALAFSVYRAMNQLRSIPARHAPIAVAGAPQLVPLLAKELRAGGDPAAVVEGVPTRHVAALVWVGPADEGALRSATKAGTPIVGLTEGESLPYVLDTNLVRAHPGRGLPVEEIAAALARGLGGDAPAVAASLPVLRRAVVATLIGRSVRQNGIIGATVFLGTGDLPALTLNQALLTVRMAVASGRDGDVGKLWPELAGVVGAGFALRRFARRLELLPVPRFAIRGGVAVAGTWAVGEALKARFDGAR